MRLSDELGLAIVLITHDLPIVAQTCQTAAVMYAGRIAELRPDGRAARRAAAPVHAHAVRRHARPGRHDRRRVDPGRAAAPRPAARGLPVRAALRLDVRDLPRACARRCWPVGARPPGRLPPRRGLGRMSTGTAARTCATSSCTTRCRAGSWARSARREERVVRAVDGISLTRRGGRARRARRRVGLRQDDDRPGDHAHARAALGLGRDRRAATSRRSRSARCGRCGARRRSSSRIRTSRSTRATACATRWPSRS